MGVVVVDSTQPVHRHSSRDSRTAEATGQQKLTEATEAAQKLLKAAESNRQFDLVGDTPPKSSSPGQGLGLGAGREMLPGLTGRDSKL
jgi:hypothetical protein